MDKLHRRCEGRQIIRDNVKLHHQQRYVTYHFVNSSCAKLRRTSVENTFREVNTPPDPTCTAKITAAEITFARRCDGRENKLLGTIYSCTNHATANRSNYLPTKNNASFLARYLFTSLICSVSLVLIVAILSSKLFSHPCIFITLTPAVACDVNATRLSVIPDILDRRRENFLDNTNCIGIKTKTIKPNPATKAHPIPTQPSTRIAIDSNGAQMI